MVLLWGRKMVEMQCLGIRGGAVLNLLPSETDGELSGLDEVRDSSLEFGSFHR